MNPASERTTLTASIAAPLNIATLEDAVAFIERVIGIDHATVESIPRHELPMLSSPGTIYGRANYVDSEFMRMPSGWHGIYNTMSSERLGFRLIGFIYPCPLTAEAAYVCVLIREDQPLILSLAEALLRAEKLGSLPPF